MDILPGPRPNGAPLDSNDNTPNYPRRPKSRPFNQNGNNNIIKNNFQTINGSGSRDPPPGFQDLGNNYENENILKRQAQSQQNMQTAPSVMLQQQLQPQQQQQLGFGNQFQAPFFNNPPVSKQGFMRPVPNAFDKIALLSQNNQNDIRQKVNNQERVIAFLLEQLNNVDQRFQNEIRKN